MGQISLLQSDRNEPPEQERAQIQQHSAIVSSRCALRGVFTATPDIQMAVITVQNGHSLEEACGARYGHGFISFMYCIAVKLYRVCHR